MDKMTSSNTKKFASVLVLALVGALSAGCGTDGIFGIGGGGGSSTPSAAAEESPQKEAPQPSESSTTEPVVKHSTAAEEPQTPEPTEPEPAEPQPQDFVGEIELSVEGRPGVEVFVLAATECKISPTEVNVTGQGFDLSTGEPSQLVIRTKPLEELGERPHGVFQAVGSIVMTVANEEYVSDGRDYIVEGHVLPSMFTYRMEDPGIKYVVSWWSGDVKVSAGYVKVSCDA